MGLQRPWRGVLVDFAIGSDTGGSVRGPAGFCGIYGLRPTHGRISMAGALPLAPSFDTCGWFARDAVTMARVGEVLFSMPTPGGHDGSAKTPGGVPVGEVPGDASSGRSGTRPGARLRAGRLLRATDAFALSAPGVNDRLAPAVARVEALLGPAAAVDVSVGGLRAWFDVFRVLQYADIWASHGEWVERTRPRFGSQIAPRFEAVAQVTAAEIAAATAAQVAIRARLDAMLAEHAVLLLPTMPDVAPLRGASPADTVAFRERALALLCVAGLGGLPQISLPMAHTDDGPLGLSLIAGRGNDELLLDLARRLHDELS